MKRIVNFWLVIIAVDVLLLTGCNHLYKAGNLASLDYQVETSLRLELIQTYCDTLIIKYGYGVPAKWSNKNKLVELDSVNNKRIYFKSNPEEMYLISFGGMLELTDVFNPNIRSDGGYVARRELMSKEQELRVTERFKREILGKIEEMAKRDGLADSVIYK